jgi:hypothetical protein
MITPRLSAGGTQSIVNGVAFAKSSFNLAMAGRRLAVRHKSSWPCDAIIDRKKDFI